MEEESGKGMASWHGCVTEDLQELSFMDPRVRYHSDY